MIDWGVARQVAGLVAGSPDDVPVPPALQGTADQAAGLVSRYTGLEPVAGALPPAEAVDRPAWIEANLRSFRTLLHPLAERAAARLPSGPLQPAVRSGAGLLLGVEVGVLLGYLSQRVLGQFDLVLVEPESPTRLLFVTPNLDEVRAQLGADREELLTWVALHEVTHALQFTGVRWLREHMAGLVHELTDSLDVKVDASRLLRIPSSEDLRAMAAAVREGSLLSLVTTPTQRGVIDRIQATMAVIEGYAEHVMDAVGRELLPSLPELRAGFDRRRRSQSAAARVLNRLLGLDLKLRQYLQGKAFCDAVAREGGIDALNAVWDGPGALPTLAELDAPGAWLRRVRPAAA